MIDIKVKSLFKSYEEGKIPALQNVSFKVSHGELFGIIGPDGAGKTTLFRILTTLLLADSGEAEVTGSDVVKDYRAIRRKVGYMPGRFSLYQDLTVEENLQFFASVFNTSVKENYALISDIYKHLEPFKTRRAGNLSGGMKQKLALCCALIHRPQVLFLDEPTTGVDTVSRKEFWDMLKRLKAEGITILVSTPYMDEANLCERIALIQGGSIMSVDRPSAIINNYPDQVYAIKSDHMSQLLRDLRHWDRIKSVHSFGEFHHITFGKTMDGKLVTNEVNDRLNHANLQVHSIAPTIEDCFIHLMSSKENYAA